MSIWEACPLQEKSAACMNSNIQNKITGWSNLVSGLEPYWTSDEFNSSLIYRFDPNGEVLIYADYLEDYLKVRCVRDH